MSKPGKISITFNATVYDKVKDYPKVYYKICKNAAVVNCFLTNEEALGGKDTDMILIKELTHKETVTSIDHFPTNCTSWTSCTYMFTVVNPDTANPITANIKFSH